LYNETAGAIKPKSEPSIRRFNSFNDPMYELCFRVRFDFDCEICGENRGDVTHLYMGTFSQDIWPCSCAIPFEFAVPAQANSYNLSRLIGLHDEDLTRLVHASNGSYHVDRKRAASRLKHD
jgi:hypothetical protein